MPGTGKYTTFDPVPTKDPAVGKGKSDLVALSKIFKTSPLKNDGSNRTTANAMGQAFLTPPSVDDGGYMYGVVDLNYGLAPDLAADVKTGGAGLPSTAWTPNLNSPGEGNGADPTKVDPMDPTILPKPSLSLDPAGEGLVSPKATAQQISSITLGAVLTPGKRPGAV